MRIIAVACTLLLFSQAQGQLRKGQWMLGGSVDYSYNKSDGPSGVDHTNKLTSYDISPAAGYFFMDRFCGGIRLSLTGVKEKDDLNASTLAYTLVSKTESRTSGTGGGVFLRYYFLPMARKINLFADAGYAYAGETTKLKSYEAMGSTANPPTLTQYTATIKDNSHNYSIAAGPVVFISQQVSFELIVGGRLRKANKQDITSKQIFVGTGFHVFFGK